MAAEDTGLLTIRDDADTCNPGIAEPEYTTQAFIEKGDFTNGPDGRPRMPVAVHLGRRLLSHANVEDCNQGASQSLVTAMKIYRIDFVFD
jgi:hypothetical protein